MRVFFFAVRFLAFAFWRPAEGQCRDGEKREKKGVRKKKSLRFPHSTSRGLLAFFVTTAMTCFLLFLSGFPSN